MEIFNNFLSANDISISYYHLQSQSSKLLSFGDITITTYYERKITEIKLTNPVSYVFHLYVNVYVD